MMHYEHLVRRGIAIARDTSSLNMPKDVPPQVAKMHELMQEMPQWGLLLLVATLLCGLLLIASVRYTLQGVVTTLAMVESTQTTVIVREEKPKLEYPDALTEEAIDSEVMVIKQIPITARIRSTMRHLQARGGFAARWRGLSTLLVWGVLYMVFKNTLTHLAMPFLGRLNLIQFHFVAQPVAAVFSRVLLARLGLTWTHIVISEPSAKPWYRRVPSHKAWKNVAGPTLYTAAAWQLSYLMPAAVAFALGLDQDSQSMEEQSPECVAMKVIAVAGIAIVTFVGITIPAEVALTRVQASMLPDEDESIVPFDRTFGGAVCPEILGGSGKLGFVEAWATFDYGARARLLKLYVKIFAVDVALHMFVFMVLAVEVAVILGPKMHEAFFASEFDGIARSRYAAVVAPSA